MFKTHLFIFGIALLCTTAATLTPLFHQDENDRLVFAKLLASSNPENKDSPISYAEQNRNKGSKQIWFQKKEEPISYRLVSEESALFFFSENNKIEVVEEMVDAKCVMQEELFYLLPDGREAVKKATGRLLLRHADPLQADSWINPDLPGLTPMQYVRYFEAETANFHYNSQLLVAEKVKLWKYRLEGHECPQTMSAACPLMSATAETVECTLRQEQLDFHAKRLKATFDTQEKL